MFPLKIIENCNYIEVHIGSKHDGYFQNGMNRNTFYDILQQMRKIESKATQYNTKEYTHYFLKKVEKIDHEQVTETKVFHHKYLHTDVTQHANCVYQTRSKITSVLFPSTNQIHDMVYQKKLVFRINNRLFVNFVVEKRPNEEDMSYKIFINLNITRDTDISEMSEKIDRIVRTLTYKGPIC